MEEKHVEVGGTRISYAEQGRGKPLLLIHGNTGSRRWFQRVMDMDGMRCIAPDLPNFGASGPLPGPITIDAYADAAAGLLRELRINAAYVVGHSLGGAVALSLAVRNPKLVRGLVLVDSAAPSGLVTPADRHPFIDMMRTNRAVLSQALRAVVPTLHDEAFFEQLVDDAARMAAPAWIGNAEALGHFNYTGRCSSYAGPVLVLWGRRDVIVTEGMARETAAAFPGARLVVIDEVGHSLPAEDPPRFRALVGELVAGRKGA